MKVRFLILCIILLFQLPTFSQEEDSPDTVGVGGVDWFAYPYAFYSPESSLAFGGGGIVYFILLPKQEAKASSITPSFYYSINGQYDLTIIPEIYLFNDNLRIWSKVNYASIFDRYYGIGNKTEEIENDKYLQNNFQIQLKVQPKLFDERLNIGINYEFRDMSVVDQKGNPFLEDTALVGREGGLTSGLGLALSWDTRDNNFFPSSGGFYEIYATHFTDFWGSDYNYTKNVIDLRQYINLTLDHVLAVQAYILRETDTPPFYDLGLLGGSRIMRGYITGRYRDRVYYTIQSEYRMPQLVWRFGLILFAGVGDVATSLSMLEISTVKPTYGLGIRFRIDELQKVEVRMDVGFGKGTNGIYFDINQAF